VETSDFNARRKVHVAPYGTWKSPIIAELISQEMVGLGQIALDSDDIYWTEMRPTERGRTVLVKRSGNGMVAEVTPADMSVRSRVHEYGGGSFVVDAGDVWFCNDVDQRLYAMPKLMGAVALTPEGPYRYADMIVDRRRNRLITVRETHGQGDDEPNNCIVSIVFDKHVSTLVEGADFYGAPRLSPDGKYLAWLSWSHPNMPWDGTELWLAHVTENGELTNIECVAGDRTTSIFAPEWSSEGELHFVSDQTGWWNLYRWNSTQHEAVALCPMAAEFGRPQWALGMTTYGFTTDGDIICTYAVNGEWRLGQLEKGEQLREIKTEYCAFNSLVISGQRAAFIAGHSVDSSALVLLDLKVIESMVVRRAMDINIDPKNISIGMAIDVPSGDGVDVHAYFYAPVNNNYSGPVYEKAPLIVKSHGGPTGQTTQSFSLGIQFWTSRGFAVLDVNYSGSSGYGRAYRSRLDGRWGEVDVEDCISCVQYLVSKELVDGERVVITGGSAGGFTTLCALTFHDIFRAGASYYGIGDLEALARDTHKFESRYLDRLVGRWPEDEELYRARSPIHHTDRLTCPVIFFQGLDDKVVPPNQAKVMVDALLHKNLPVAYVAFEGEGHGFRLSENIEQALQSELYFYGRVFDFQPADRLEPVDIANL